MTGRQSIAQTKNQAGGKLGQSPGNGGVFSLALGDPE